MSSRPSPPSSSISSVSIAGLDFNRLDTLRTGLRRLNLKPQQVGPLVGEALRASPANARTLAHALVIPATARPTKADREATDANAAELVRWAATQKRDERFVVVSALAQASRKRDLINGIAQLQRTQARAFLKDYFEAGGDLRSVVEWVGEAGALLRLAHKRELAAETVDGLDLLKGIKDAWEGVKDFGSAVVKPIGEAVNTLLDGIETAGRTLGDIFSEAGSWTASRVEDLVEALIDAGKKTVDLLVAAAKQGVEAIRGTIYGLLRAGRALADIVKWAAVQTESTLLTTIDSILDLGRGVAQVMTEAVKLAAEGLKAVVQAILQSGRKVGQVLAAVASRGASIVRTTLEGVLAARLHLADVVAAVCRDVAEAFRKDFISGLIALGKGAAEIFKAAMEKGLAIGALAFAALLEAFGGHRGLTENERLEACKVFGNAAWLKRVKVANASLPADLIQSVNTERPFTTMYVLNYSSKLDFKADGELKSLGTLIHELTHVWQGVQDGPVYMIEALEQQLRARLDKSQPNDDETYEATDVQLKANRGDLSKFSREAQAGIIEKYYRSRFSLEQKKEAWLKYLPYAEKVKDTSTLNESVAPIVLTQLLEGLGPAIFQR